MKALKITLVIITLFTLASCTIYENDIDGEVDLIYSDTITIYEEDFVSEDDFITVAAYGWDNLNEYTVDNGLVLGYLRFEGTTAWQSLPLSTPYENDLVVLRYLFDVDSFNLILEGEVAGNNEVNASLFDGDVLRIIAIPPDQIVRGKGINYNSYEDVVRLYNLQFD